MVYSFSINKQSPINNKFKFGRGIDVFIVISKLFQWQYIYKICNHAYLTLRKLPLFILVLIKHVRIMQHYNACSLDNKNWDTIFIVQPRNNYKIKKITKISIWICFILYHRQVWVANMWTHSPYIKQFRNVFMSSNFLY